jgi:hypothetical protein
MMVQGRMGVDGGRVEPLGPGLRSVKIGRSLAHLDGRKRRDTLIAYDA